MYSILYSTLYWLYSILIEYSILILQYIVLICDSSMQHYIGVGFPFFYVVYSICTRDGTFTIFWPRPVGTFLRPGPARSNKIIFGPFGPVSINHFKTIAFKIFLVKTHSSSQKRRQDFGSGEGNIQQTITQSL